MVPGFLFEPLFRSPAFLSIKKPCEAILSAEHPATIKIKIRYLAIFEIVVI